MLAAKAGGWGVAVDPDITYALKIRSDFWTFRISMGVSF